MGCETSHICHTSRKNESLYLIALFYKMQNVILLLSQDRPEKAAQRNCSYLSMTTLSLSTSLSLAFSISRSALLVSHVFSLTLNLSLPLSRIVYPTHFILPLCLSPFLFFTLFCSLSKSFSFFCSFSHTHSLTQSDSFRVLLSLSLCLFLFLSLSPPSLVPSLSHTRTHHTE